MHKVYLVLIFSFFWSCSSNNEKEVVGTWIQIKNYKNPETLVVKKDSFKFSSDYSHSLYKIKNDTLLFQTYGEIRKIKYKVTGDTLTLSSLMSDTLNTVFINNNNNSSNVLEIWNSDLNLSINLPTLPTDVFKWEYQDNTIILDNDSSELIILNGKKLSLDENLYLHLLETSDYKVFDKPGNNLFIDKDVKFKNIIILFNELSKAYSRKVKFLTYDSSMNLNQFLILSPFISFNYPDSITKKYLLPPPPIDKNYNKELDLICEFKVDKLLVNNIELSFNEFQNLLISRLNTKKHPFIYLHFEDNLTYQQYIEYLFKLKRIYKDIKKQYSLEKFGTADRYKLNTEQRNEVRELFPLLIKYVDTDWLNQNIDR